MTKILAHLETQKNISVTLDIDGEWDTINVPLSHEDIDEIRNAIDNKDAEKLFRLIDVGGEIERYTNENIVIEDGVLTYKGVELNNSLIERIIKLSEEGRPFEYLIKFLDNLMRNPSRASVNELFDFLNHTGLPITDDGHFLAYKGISEDFKDLYTGNIDNSIGSKPEMVRNMVDDERRNECSYGLHAGTYEYASEYCSGRGKIVIVKIDPADAVSVPKDYDCSKLRVCKYEVMKEFEKKLDQSAYSSGAEEIPADLDEEDDEEDYSGDGWNDGWDDWGDDFDDDEDYDDDEVDNEIEEEDRKSVLDYAKRLMNLKHNASIERIRNKFPSFSRGEIENSIDSDPTLGIDENENVFYL